MSESETTQLARHFAERITRVQAALQVLRIPSYVDEISFALPVDAPQFERFVYWTETLAATVNHWATLVEVNVTFEPAAIAEAKDATASLAKTAREVLTVYMGAR